MVYDKSKRRYQRIIIEGIVQGVGFRPFVYTLAQRCRVTGGVANKGGFVEILAAAEQADMEAFLSALTLKAPPKSKINHLSVTEVAAFCAEAFCIFESEIEQGVNRFISPDLPLCHDCENEIFHREDRRFGHFFNSCVNCGPRFSVIESLPYDREHTSMGCFPLCDACTQEYTSPADRRFHAETVCCNHCGPVLSYITADAKTEGEEAFDRAVSDVKNGGVLAIKGIGGYHLACSPFDEKAVAVLRHLKRREYKPFAVMFKDIEKVREICEVGENDAALLQSDARPITLLPLIKDIFAESVLMKNNRCGCFLPYTPLHLLLLDACDCLVMTSANISGSSIIYDDEEMRETFFADKIYSPDNMAYNFHREAEWPSIPEEGTQPLNRSSKDFFRQRYAGMLTHNRRIVRSIEDSVAQMLEDKPQIIRRARGLAPDPFPLRTTHQQAYLAMGGDLKASFCLVKNGYAYVSPYLGDLEEASAYSHYKKELADFLRLFDITPQFVLCDGHPGYFSTALAETLGLPVYKVQHHFAHAASVLAEHQIYEPVIGVCFDGTGYGDDGNLWGGEFLLCDGAQYKRAGHIGYVPLIGADSAARDAKKTALCYLIDANCVEADSFDERLPLVRDALSSRTGVHSSSSVGRLFDALAALLHMGEENQYEGQCAAALQQAAERAIKNSIPPVDLHFTQSKKEGMRILDTTSIIQAVCEHRTQPEAVARGFHLALAEASADICEQISKETGVRQVVLSGGVFQNSLLTALTRRALTARGMRSWVNRWSPPNDGGISLGQAYVGG